MKLTRRRLARMLAISAALPAGASPQVPVRGAASDVTPGADTEVAAARDEFREAARSLAAVKLPRSAEPAARFEA
jgi:hypothetical protein